MSKFKTLLAASYARRGLPMPEPIVEINSKQAAAAKVHSFIHQLNELLDAGESPEVVWRFCIEHTTEAKRALAVTLNHYQKRTGADELSES